MATCRTCAYLRKCIEKSTKEGYEHNVDFDASSGCPNFGFKPNTNVDRIRAMSDEELAVFLRDVESDYVQYPFVQDWDEWLKQPADMRGEEDG